MSSIYPLKGVVQHYAWGGFDFIPNFLNEKKEPTVPSAELWLGAHPKGVSLVKVGDEWLSLQQFIATNPVEVLGQKSIQSFGEILPYLFKILDVRKMLSIQVHPNKEAAAKGFEEENKLGVPLTAFHRNFRDDNHKPEMMWALTDFWLLHGFKTKEAIDVILEEIPEFQSLRPVFDENKSIAALYQYVMELPQDEINVLLSPLKERLFARNKKKALPKESPGYWANCAFQDFTTDNNYDRGIFSIYFLNLVFLQKGESIFQDSGILHAYLEGVNLELMANSDNVLRGGLTPKHIDVPELMKHVRFEAVVPVIVQPKLLNAVEAVVGSPAPDFELRQIKVTAEQKYIRKKGQGAEIYLVLQGTVESEGYVFVKGNSFFVPDNTGVDISGEGVLFRAGLPSYVN